MRKVLSGKDAYALSFLAIVADTGGYILENDF
jgi:hypothetical protein